ncbi:MAG: Maf family protein [Bdellovibrionales bacterium]|nr:Maf family protein [Bdellovibrionales bacterium]
MKNSFPEIILASTSPYRKALLDQIKLPFRSIAPQVDEAALIKKNPHLSTEELCKLLAKAKGQDIREKNPRSLIIASDQMVEMENEIYGKAKSMEEATKQLQKLQGKTHRILTSLFISSPQHGIFLHLETAFLTLRPLNLFQIQSYLEQDQPMDCAGSYKLEKCGITLMKKIECRDSSAIVGLPIVALTNQLLEWQYPLPFCYPSL